MFKEAWVESISVSCFSCNPSSISLYIEWKTNWIKSCAQMLPYVFMLCLQIYTWLHACLVYLLNVIFSCFLQQLFAETLKLASIWRWSSPNEGKRWWVLLWRALQICFLCALNTLKQSFIGNKKKPRKINDHLELSKL